MRFDQTPPEQDVREQWALTVTRFHEWLGEELFIWQWWALLILMATTIFLIWKTADRARLVETALYTAFVTLFVIVLDEIGEEMSLWAYPVDLFFMFPPTTAVNLSCFPLAYMLIYQWFRSWKGFAAATAAMAVLFCFAAEPLFLWSGVYVTLKWKSFYGLPIYAGIAFASKAAVQLVSRLSEPRAPLRGPAGGR